MKRTYRDTLIYLGAEEHEVGHLLRCKECDLFADYDGVSLERCDKNPEVIRRAIEAEQYRIAHGLMAAFQLPRRDNFIPMAALEPLMEEYKAALVEELNRPIFGFRRG